MKYHIIYIYVYIYIYLIIYIYIYIFFHISHMSGWQATFLPTVCWQGWFRYNWIQTWKSCFLTGIKGGNSQSIQKSMSIRKSSINWWYVGMEWWWCLDACHLKNVDEGLTGSCGLKFGWTVEPLFWESNSCGTVGNESWLARWCWMS